MNLTVETLIHVLPLWLRKEITPQRLSQLLEIRLRCGQAVELVMIKGSVWLSQVVKEDDLRFCVNLASKYSPWTAASLYQGFITIEGGHRIGVSGCWTIDDSGRRSINRITSLCVRVSRDFEDISGKLYQKQGSILILGSPGSGKTTLLRDLIRQISNNRTGAVCVIDERKELFPINGDVMCYSPGIRTDVISGCSKEKGIEMAIRCMSPKVIAIDEITAAEDCKALIEAGWCGVDILATVHASGKCDLYNRPVYKPLVESGLFKEFVVMNADKSWTLERM